ncbi:MAG: TetR/AcrR family transcriptional regulator [Pseudomonadota bacterium]
MARPRQFNETDAIEAAMVVFWIRGYAGTNLPDLLDAMSLTRGSFYKAFEDKYTVYRRALDHYGATRMDNALSALTDKNGKPPRERLIEFFQRSEHHPAKPAPRIGCFVCNTMVEMAPFDPECARVCNEISQRVTEAIQSVLAEISPERPASVQKRKASALQRLYMGAHAMGRTGSGYGQWVELLDDLL